MWNSWSIHWNNTMALCTYQFSKHSVPGGVCKTITLCLSRGSVNWYHFIFRGQFWQHLCKCWKHMSFDPTAPILCITLENDNCTDFQQCSTVYTYKGSGKFFTSTKKKKVLIFKISVNNKFILNSMNYLQYLHNF